MKPARPRYVITLTPMPRVDGIKALRALLKSRPMTISAPTRSRRSSMSADDQPFVDRWPMNDEQLGKIDAPFDVVHARWQLAKKFNRRLPTIPPTERDREIDRAWLRHERVRNRG
jgi:hypothetical protein